MRRFRGTMILLLALIVVSGVTGFSRISASSHYNICKAYIPAGTTSRWFPTSDQDGFVLTNGGAQTLYFALTEKGHQCSFGFSKTSSGAKYSWFNGTLSTKTKTATKNLSAGSGYYKIYLTNNNATVQITVKDTSYADVK